MKWWILPLLVVLCGVAVVAPAQDVTEDAIPAPADAVAPVGPGVQYQSPIPSWYGGCCEYPPSHAAHIWDGYCHERHHHGFGFGHGCGHFGGGCTSCKSHCWHRPYVWHGCKTSCQKTTCCPPPCKTRCCRKFHFPKLRLGKCCPRPCGRLFHRCKSHCCGKGGAVIEGPVQYSEGGDMEIPVPAPPIQGQST